MEEYLLDDLDGYEVEDWESNPVLPCGCEQIVVNGKVVWITCDEHDAEEMVPEKPLIKKFRKTNENN